MSKDKEEQEPKTFYLFSLRYGRTDITLNIPAKSEHEALELLEEVTMHPENWQREEAIENKIKDKKTTGQRKASREWTPPVTDDPGPMFG